MTYKSNVNSVFFKLLRSVKYYAMRNIFSYLYAYARSGQFSTWKITAFSEAKDEYEESYIFV